MLPTSRPPLPLLLTGVAGVAGYNAFQYFRQRYPGQVYAVRRPDNWPLRGEGIIACDVDDNDRLRRLFDQHQFRSVLNCEGTCKLKSCELDPAMATRINIHTVSSLLDVLEGTDVRLVHLSIDLVYSGTRGGGHVESDATDPVTIYGKTMAQAEELILARRPQSCIFRISLPMGVSFNGHAGAIDWIQSRFKKHKPATLYYDEVRTPTYTDCLNPLLERALADGLRGRESLAEADFPLATTNSAKDSRPLQGLYHAGGPRRLSLYQIAQIVNRVGGYRPQDLMGCPRIEAGPIPPRAGDVTLDSSKLTRTLGYDPFDPWPLPDEFVPTHRDWHKERPQGEAGSAQLLAEILYRNPRYATVV